MAGGINVVEQLVGWKFCGCVVRGRVGLAEGGLGGKIEGSWVVVERWSGRWVG